MTAAQKAAAKARYAREGKVGKGRRSGGRRSGAGRARKGGGRRGSMTFSATTVVAVGGTAILVSPKVRAALAPVAAAVQNLTGLTGKDLVLATFGNRLLCSLVPRLGAAERAALRPIGLRP